MQKKHFIILSIIIATFLSGLLIVNSPFNNNVKNNQNELAGDNATMNTLPVVKVLGNRIVPRNLAYDFGTTSVDVYQGTSTADQYCLTGDSCISTWPTGGSFTGTLNDISDVATTTTSNGDVLMWNGTAWTNKATSTLGLVGSGSMVYPEAGIALSTGSGWGTSITNNSANWNTAYSSLFASGTNGMVLTTNGTIPLWKATSTLGFSGGGSGTVTSVDLSLPTGLSVSGNPITTSGTLAVALTAGFIIPQSASTTAWNNFLNTPSGIITAGDGIDWSVNTLNVDNVTPAMLNASDFGDFTCNGTTCSLDASFSLSTHNHNTLYDVLGQATSSLGSHTTTYNHTNYDTAYGWGNWALQGLETQAQASSSFSLLTHNHSTLYDVLGQATSTLGGHTTTYNHANYDTAYGWGNHAGLYDILGQATSTLGSHTTAFNHANFLTAGVNETYGSGWNADTAPPEKDDVYDYLHLLDTDDDGSANNLDTDAVDAITELAAALKDGSGDCGSGLICLGDHTHSGYQAAESTLTDIADGTIAENLVNTAYPWADNEVADDITASNYLLLTGGTISGTATTTNLTVVTNSKLGTVISGTWNGSTIGVGYGGTGLTSATAGYFLIGNSATALQATSTIFIDTTGRVGIGTTTPQAQFVVNSTGTATTTTRLGSNLLGTNPGKLCFWNGTNYTIEYYPPNSATKTIATSTTCN
jgi:hypothetical protein